MIPVLYDANEKAFTSNGLGRLSDALTCTVTEEVNGIYELNMTYPLDGIHIDDIQANAFIYSRPAYGKGPQPFRIREVNKSFGNNVSIVARHVKNELGGYALAEFGEHGWTGYTTDPILYGSTHQEIGVLTGTISKSVTKNGNVYTLTIVYPANGRYANQITSSCYLYYQPEVGKVMAEFDITSVRTLQNQMTIVATRTGSSSQRTDLNMMPIQQALSCVYNYTINGDENVLINFPFTYEAVPDTIGDAWSTEAKAFWNEYPISITEALDNNEGHIIDVYGGEWEWDHYNCILHEHRGQDNGVIYKYGKNITDISAVTNIDEFYTHVVSYWKGSMSSSTNVNYIDNKYTEYYINRGHLLQALPTEYEPLFPNIKTLILDASSEFDEIPTKEQLDDYSRWYIKNNEVGIPRVAITIDVVDLASTEEYKNYAPLETVQLCDYVTVMFPSLGVDIKEQVSKIEYNVLTDKNDSVTIGETKMTLADHLASNKENLRKNKYSNQKWADRCAERAIRASSGWYGGNIRKQYNTSDHKQQSMYVMDTDNIETADHALVMDGNGLGGATGLSGKAAGGGTYDAIIALRNKYGNIGVNGSKVNFGIVKSQEGNQSKWDLESGETDMYLGDSEKYFHGNNQEVKSTGLPVELKYDVDSKRIKFSLDQNGALIQYDADTRIVIDGHGILITNGTNNIRIDDTTVYVNDTDLVEAIGESAGVSSTLTQYIEWNNQQLEDIWTRIGG